MKVIESLEAPEAPYPHGVSAYGLHETEHLYK